MTARFLCGCPLDEATVRFDGDDFPVCPDHGLRLYGWMTTPTGTSGPDHYRERDRRAEERRRIEETRRIRVLVGEAGEIVGGSP